ncbi:MAG TPA: hypothetical protein PLV92_10045 [Pirellulaceae bacterium]|nr:hypothetical protein [Pirellulaceae bacterium]
MFRPTWLCRFCFALVLFGGVARGADDEAARLKVKLFERVDYPLRLKQLDSDLRLARAEVESYQKLFNEYSRFNRYLVDSKPFTAQAEEYRLKLLAAQLRCENLEEERVLLERYRVDERRLRELEARRGATSTTRR